jgi:hypothetical protein
MNALVPKGLPCRAIGGLMAIASVSTFSGTMFREEVSASAEAGMNEIDPWEKAAECHCLVSTATNPERKAIFKNLRELWIAIGNARCLMTKADLAEEIEAVDRIHADLIGEASRLH